MHGAEAPPSPVGRFYKAVVTALIVSLGLTALAGIALFGLDPNDDLLERSFSSMCIVALCFGVWTAAGAVLRRRRFEQAMALACLAAGCGAVVVLALIWFEDLYYSEGEELLGKSAATLLILSVALAHSGVFSIIPVRTRLLLLLRILTMATLWVGGSVVCAMFWLEEMINDFRTIILLLIICSSLLLFAGIGTLVIPIGVVSRANRRETPSESIASRVKVLLECPECSVRQELPAGNVRCVKCKASIFMEVEEPRCTCGYLLYQLRGDTCPECGREVPQADRWAGAESTGLSRT